MDFPEGPKPGANDLKFYNNPAYKKKSKRKKGAEEDEDLDHYYTYPKHKHATDGRFEKRPPLPSEKGKIKSGKDKIKKKSKDKKKKQKIDPSLYGEAFHNRAFDEDDVDDVTSGGSSGTVKSSGSGIYESIRDPDPNYMGLDRTGGKSKTGTAHSNHGYLSVDRKQDGEPSNFDALRFQPGGDQSDVSPAARRSATSNDGYLTPSTLRGDTGGRERDSRLKTPQANPLFQGPDSDSDENHNKSPKTLRQDSGYQSPKAPKSTFRPLEAASGDKSDDEDSISPYAEYFPAEKIFTDSKGRPILGPDQRGGGGGGRQPVGANRRRPGRGSVFTVKNPVSKEFASRTTSAPSLDGFGSGAAVFQANGSPQRKSPAHRQYSSGSVFTAGGTSPIGPSRSGSVMTSSSVRSNQTPGSSFHGGSRFGDLREEQTMYIDVPRDPDALYDRADGLKTKSPDDTNGLYDRADGLKSSNTDRRLTRYDDDLNRIYDKADGIKVKSSSAKGQSRRNELSDLYDRPDAYRTKSSPAHAHDVHALYDRADNVTRKSKMADRDLVGLYDRADNVGPSGGAGRKRLPRSDLSDGYGRSPKRSYLRDMP